MAVKFAHVSLSCEDPIAVERFYTRHFGFKRARVCPLPDGSQVIFTRSGDVYLEIFKADQARPSPPAGLDGPHHPCIRHIAFQVDNVEAKLKQMGGDARISLGPMAFDAFIPGWKTVWVTDPEGNVVEISEGYKDEDNPAPLE